MTGALNFGDNVKAQFGAGSDLQIYHTGTKSVVSDQGAGNLQLQGNDLQLVNATDTATYLYAVNGSFTKLYHNNNEKLATTSIGVDVTGRLVADSIQVQDNDKIIVGASGDLEIYHDGSNSIIKDTGTGGLQIRASANLQLQDADGYLYVNCIDGGNGGTTKLYHLNQEKLATTANGVDITGSLAATGIITADVGYGQVNTASKTGATTPDFDTYQTFVWTLTGNITLSNPADEAAGMSGVFVFIHSGAARTVSLGTDYETVGGAGLTLSSTAGATDVVPFVVAATGRIILGQPLLAVS